jgi:hypothetical protein
MKGFGTLDPCALGFHGNFSENCSSIAGNDAANGRDGGR